MDTKEIVKEYEDAIDNYFSEIKEYKKTMKIYRKDRAKNEKIFADLVRIRIDVDDHKGEKGKIDFYISTEGYEKIKDTYSKQTVDFVWPVEPFEPQNPVLQLFRGGPCPF